MSDRVIESAGLGWLRGRHAHAVRAKCQRRPAFLGIPPAGTRNAVYFCSFAFIRLGILAILGIRCVFSKGQCMGGREVKYLT